MKTYADRSREELLEELKLVQERYDELKSRGLSLNMARGKPGTDQLDMNRPMMDLLRSDSDYVSDGIDVRNYGNLEGIPACRRLFAELLGVRPENIFVGGSASLQLMYDTISSSHLRTFSSSESCSSVPQWEPSSASRIEGMPSFQST